MKHRYDTIGQSGRQSKRMEKQRKRLQGEVGKMVVAVMRK